VVMSLATVRRSRPRGRRGAERNTLRATLRFCLGGAYLRGVLALGLETGRAYRAVTRCELSRHVGVARFATDSRWVLEAVFDTTDIRRGVDEPIPLVMLICRDASCRAQLVGAAKTSYPRALVP